MPISSHESRVAPVIITEPADLDGMATITSLYPGKSAEEKAAMLKQSLIPEYAACRDGRRTVLLAKSGKETLGTVQVIWDHPTEEAALLLPDSAVIHHLRVHPNYRGQGLGQRLLDAAERLAIKRGVVQLTLGVEADNAIARNLYTKHGFRDFMTYDGPHDTPIIGMRKHLAL